MRQAIKKNPTQHRTPKTTHEAIHPPLPDNQPLTNDSPALNQIMCSCDGGCPRCKSQDDLHPDDEKDDPLEKEADQIAAQVVNAPAPPPAATKQAGSEPKAQTTAKPVVQNTKPSHAPSIAKSAQIESQETEQEDKEESEESLKSFSTGVPSDPKPPINPAQTGEPLPISEREYFEPRFGQDFGHVRIHRDNEAAHYSRHLRAKAFAVGNHIFFGEKQYQPGILTGQKLMAHELTHVAQQTQKGANPGIQRTEDEELEREYQLDWAQSRILNMLFGQFSTQDHILHSHASTLRNTFHTTGGRPLTQRICAQLLLQIYQTGRIPDADIFSEENLAEWQEVVAEPMPEPPITNARRHAGSRPQARPAAAPEAVVENEVPETSPETQASPVQVTSNLGVVQPTSAEQAAGGRMGGDREILAGLARLRGTRLSSNAQAVTQSVAQNFELDTQTQSLVTPNASLLNVAGVILYISGLRCYILDRTGHISGDTFAFNLQWTRDMQPGTYFLSDYSAMSSAVRVLTRINGANNVSVVWTHLRTPGAQHASIGENTLDFQVGNRLEMSRILQRSGGIGIIISRNAPQPGNQPTSVLSVNLHRVEQAWENAFTRRLLLWAIETKINDVWNNLFSELSQAAVDNIVEAIITRVPQGRAAMLMMMGLQLAAWLGEVSSIAGFGTPDEMELAAQYIARSIVNFVIDEFVLEGAVGMAGSRASRVFRWRLRTRGGVAEGQQPVSADIPDAAPVQTETPQPAAPAPSEAEALPESPVAETSTPAAPTTGTAPSPGPVRQTRLASRVNFEGEEGPTDISGGRAFNYRPPRNQRMDPLDPASIPPEGPMPARPAAPAAQGEGSSTPAPVQRPGNLPSPQRNLPDTLTPEMMEGPFIGRPPAPQPLDHPTISGPTRVRPEPARPVELVQSEESDREFGRVEQTVQAEEMVRIERTEDPGRYNLPDLNSLTLRIYAAVLEAVNFERRNTASESEAAERPAPQTTEERGQEITVRRNELNRLQSTAEGIPRFDRRLLNNLFRLANRRLDLEQEINDIGNASREEQISMIMSLIEQQQEVEGQIIALIDRPNLGWGNIYRHNRSLTEVIRIAMNYSVQQALDIVDTNADTVNWTTETPPDQVLSTGIAEAVPLQPGHEFVIPARELQQPNVDDHGNSWYPIEGTSNWRVRLSEAGHRYITQVLRINLLQYIQTEASELDPSAQETFSQRLGRSYLIVDNEGRLVPHHPRFLSRANDIIFLATNGTNIDPANVEWIYVPAESVWALRERGGSGRIITYITEDGEMITPNQEELAQPSRPGEPAAEQEED